jgi:hypothetical protein
VLERGRTVHEWFEKESLRKTDAAPQTHDRSLVFTGKASMPKALGADAEVVGYVAKTKGANGYVSASASMVGVKTIEVRWKRRLIHMESAWNPRLFAAPVPPTATAQTTSRSARPPPSGSPGNSHS